MGTQGISALGLFDPLTGERRTGHPGIENGVPFLFQPLPQLRHLRGASDGVRAFDDDQLALQLGTVHTRQGEAIELQRFASYHSCLLTAYGVR